MTPSDKIPEGKFIRSYIGSKTAVNVGSKVFGYMVKKPFLSKSRQTQEIKKLHRKNAKSIFSALILLKGTALKIAQMLSMEMEFIPEEIRIELEKSYNQVPPLNRAIVRKVLFNEFGDESDTLFRFFNDHAFAAASLGQVHQADDHQNNTLAVKIQYPGIAGTIKNDMFMVKNLLKPLPEYKFIRPSLQEIEVKLEDEVNYQQEADNLMYFKKNLKMSQVVIPGVYPLLSGRTVLSTDMIQGPSLDQWLKKNQSQEDKNKVANLLNQIFITSLYRLNTIHADPNPGNFIIVSNNKIGLIDFGCIKKFKPGFVNLYSDLVKTAQKKDKDNYFRIARKMKIFNKDLNPDIESDIIGILFEISDIFSRLYTSETFDFGKNKSFLSDITQSMKKMQPYVKHFDSNPEFVFLDRTRYGLFRIFGKMNACVKIRNPFEYGDS